MAPDVFWGLTPWQFAQCVDGWQDGRREDHEHAVWLMWHTAALERAQPMPPMSDFLQESGPIKKPSIDEDAVKAHFRAYRKRRTT